MKNLILILFTTTLFSSCIDSDGLELLKLSQNINDWGEYNKGTIWVFQNDSLLSTCDTIKVSRDFNVSQGSIGDVSKIDTSINYNKEYYEWCDTYICSPLNNSNNRSFDSFIQVTGIGVISWEEEYYELEIKIPKGAFRINENGVITEKIHYYDTVIEAEKLYSYQVLGKNYNEIAHISIYPPDSDNVYQYWISKNNWIIKKLLYHNGQTYSWSVKESTIVQ
ncbi:MAG: hypothetical protein K9H26_00510 [Prolixibacteraceae bacterium]|nr:hypothetical protein [Prolixibacteraceae bacterium]